MSKSASSQANLPSTQLSLPMALLRARENVMHPIRAMLAESGLTEQQWRLLRILSENGPLEATVLAQKATFLLPSQTRIVQTMEKRGLVKRRPHSRDKRRHTVEITTAGLAIIDKNQDRATEIAAAFVTALGPKKFDRLLELLGHLEAADIERHLK